MEASGSRSKKLNQSVCLRIAGLFIVLSLGAFVRLVGIEHGKPRIIFHPDVTKQAYAANYIYRGIKLSQRFRTISQSLYPFGNACVLAYIVDISSRLGIGPARQEVLKRNPWWWALGLRHVGTWSYLLSTLALLIALWRKPPIVIFLGGLWLVFYPTLAEFCHYGMGDIPMVAMMILGWIFATQMQHKNYSYLFSFLSGIFIGFGFGMKYQGLFAGFFPFFMWIVLGKERKTQWMMLSAVAVLLGTIAGAITTCYILKTEPLYFLYSFQDFMEHQRSYEAQHETFSTRYLRNLKWLIYFFSSKEMIFFSLLSLWGIRYVYKRSGDRHSRSVITATLVFLCLFSLVISARSYLRLHDTLPLNAFAIIVSILVFGEMQKQSKYIWEQWLAKFVFGTGIIFVLFYANHTISDTYAFTRPDTRLKAQEWCQKNIPAGARIASERYTFPIGNPYTLEKVAKSLYQFKSKLEEKNFDFAIINSFSSGRFLDKFLPHYDKKVVDFYHQIDKKYDLIMEFSDRELLWLHPTIRIYSVTGKNPLPSVGS